VWCDIGGVETLKETMRGLVLLPWLIVRLVVAKLRGEDTSGWFD
jgi:hypothetical protein